MSEVLTTEALLAKAHDLATSLVREASEAGLTCGCAESCTGGLVSGAITSIAGSSAVLRGGIVSYDPAVKHALLGVSRAIIDDPERGVVSADCATQMCAGALAVLEADIAVSITGIAGPGGAEPGKPVGTVWFAAGRRGAIHAELHRFAGDREQVRMQAVCQALTLLREAVVEFGYEAAPAATYRS